MTAERKILFIDDDRDMRSLVLIAMPKFGLDAIAVSDGQAGLDTLAAQPDISVVVLDWMMPGMDGLEVLRKIKELDNSPPVLMLTAKSKREDILQAIAADVDDLMTKPIHMGHLVLRIQRLAGSRHPEDKQETKKGAGIAYSANTNLVIIDISETGCQFESTFPVPESSILILESDEITSRLNISTETPFPVRVANCTRAGKRYTVGAQFVGLDETTRSRLKKACRSTTGFKYTGK